MAESKIKKMEKKGYKIIAPCTYNKRDASSVIKFIKGYTWKEAKSVRNPYGKYCIMAKGRIDII